MTKTPFDFEAFIAGDHLERFEVPLYGVVHQRRINALNAQIEAATVADPKMGDERESTISPTPDLLAERDRLVAEQEESAQWIELRTLSANEFSDLQDDDTKGLLEQIAMQSQGTRNPADAEKWAQVKASAVPGAWFLFSARANDIVAQTLVMPDFSLSDSKKLSPAASSAS